MQAQKEQEGAFFVRNADATSTIGPYLYEQPWKAGVTFKSITGGCEGSYGSCLAFFITLSWLHLSRSGKFGGFHSAAAGRQVASPESALTLAAESLSLCTWDATCCLLAKKTVS